MAIIATVPSPAGANSTVWTLSRLIIDVVAQQITVVMNGYFTNAARVAGAGPMESRGWTISGASYTSILASGTLMLSIEQWIVANDAAFSGGTAS